MDVGGQFHAQNALCSKFFFIPNTLRLNYRDEKVDGV